MKSITLDDPQQRSLLRLVRHGISVYSPHSALDRTLGGMADWLVDIVTGAYQGATKDSSSSFKSCDVSFYSAPTYPQDQNVPTILPASISQQPSHTRATIHPLVIKAKGILLSTGAGRLVTFEEAQPLTKLIDFIGSGIGLPGGIPIATPQTKPIDTISIRAVGICPGDGASVLLRSGGALPDLLLTGEMKHHEALAVTELGSVAIALAHSNSERGFLRAVLQNQLRTEISQQWEKARGVALRELHRSMTQDEFESSPLYEAYMDEDVEVSVSEMDRDPYGIMICKSYLESDYRNAGRLIQGTNG